MVEILNKQRKHRVNTRRLEDLLRRLCRRYRLSSPEVTLAFVGPGTIRRLTRLYLGEDRATDVLSFPIAEKASDGKYYLGDIVICPHRAAVQARANGRSLESEIDVLAVHGFLHLLGFDHGTGIEEEEEKIHRRPARGT